MPRPTKVGWVSVRDQGDQIGRIFACWQIVFFGLFFWENYRNGQKFGLLFSAVKVNAKILTKSSLGYILGDFFSKTHLVTMRTSCEWLKVDSVTGWNGSCLKIFHSKQSPKLGQTQINNNPLLDPAWQCSLHINWIIILNLGTKLQAWVWNFLSRCQTCCLGLSAINFVTLPNRMFLSIKTWSRDYRHFISVLEPLLFYLVRLCNTTGVHSLWQFTKLCNSELSQLIWWSMSLDISYCKPKKFTLSISRLIQLSERSLSTGWPDEFCGKKSPKALPDTFLSKLKT
jgi:hypothetical protein